MTLAMRMRIGRRMRMKAMTTTTLPHGRSLPLAQPAGLALCFHTSLFMHHVPCRDSGGHVELRFRLLLVVVVVHVAFSPCSSFINVLSVRQNPFHSMAPCYLCISLLPQSQLQLQLQLSAGRHLPLQQLAK